MKLVRDMEEEIEAAARIGAPEEEIEELMVRALEITRRIMDARRAEELTLEQEMERAFTRSRRSGEPKTPRSAEAG